MQYRFKQTEAFKKFLESLNKSEQEIVKKALRKLKDTVDHERRKSTFLQGRLAGTRKFRFSQVRIFYRICNECRELNHDKIYERCAWCERADDLINIIDGDMRGSDTYRDTGMFDKHAAQTPSTEEIEI